MLSFFVFPKAFAETSFADPEDVAIRFGSGNLVLGKNKAKSELCQECHSDADSPGSADISVPHLTGQYGGYLLKQLRNFKSGERKHPVMSRMVENLTDEDLRNISTYFASQPALPGKGGNTNTLAQNLFMRGDMKRNILSCKSCHGVDGKGSHSANDIYPVIAGQSRFYLREQLLNWRSAARTNSPGQVMNVITKSLTDAEIEALAEYISGMQ
jgi:cytochrome c553